jgi:hypothetical protein
MLFDVKRGVVVEEAETVGDEEGGAPGPSRWSRARRLPGVPWWLTQPGVVRASARTLSAPARRGDRREMRPWCCGANGLRGWLRRGRSPSHLLRGRAAPRPAEQTCC